MASDPKNPNPTKPPEVAARVGATFPDAPSKMQTGPGIDDADVKEAIVLLTKLFAKQDDADVALRKATAAVIQRQEEDAAFEREDRERSRRFKEWCQKSTKQRTQETADARYPQGHGMHRFHAVLVEGRNEDGKMGKRKGLRPTHAFPDVFLWAHSKGEAKAFYLDVCGIIGIDGSAILKTEIRVSEPNQKLDLTIAFDPLVQMGVAADPLERELARAGVEMFGG